MMDKYSSSFSNYHSQFSNSYANSNSAIFKFFYSQTYQAHHFFHPVYDPDPEPVTQASTNITDYSNLADEYRTIDGSGNNIDQENWGQAGELFIRTTPSDYGDGLNTPAGADRPSAREISNEIFNQDVSIPDPFHSSAYFWVWGQFVDHDIDLTAGGMTELFNIEVPLGDPYFDPFNTGTVEIPLGRSAVGEGTGELGVPREQVNEVTAYLDASAVYGSDGDRSAFIRDTSGKLTLSEDGFLPYNDGTLANAGLPGMDAEDLYLAGDVRANENVALTAMHTVFAREHNRLVDELVAKHPEYSDEQLYQEARVIVEAYMQHITYDEFLPLLLGKDALSTYQGYDDSIDPQINNSFATAAYRFGHSMLTASLDRVNEDGSESALGHMLLRDAFFTPENIDSADEVNSLLRGLGTQTSQMLDTPMIDEVRNFLFGPPGSGGFDLAALNIQRGRDHGLSDYNAARVAFGLAAVITFSDITSNLELQDQLESLYGTVDNIDLFVGGLAEDPMGDSMLGELFTTVIADQFTRIRDGDRFWYEDRLTTEQIELVKDTSLADLVLRNTDIDYLQDQLLYAYDRIGGTDGNDHLVGGELSDLMIGFDGKDVLKGNDGDDTLFGGAGKDILQGGNDNDTLHGEEGRDLLIGGNGNDLLFGDEGNDQLFGGKGDDELSGGLGKDTLRGGSGENTYVFNQNEGSHSLSLADVIKGFNSDNDAIDFSALGLDIVNEVSIGSVGNSTTLAVSGEYYAFLQNVAAIELTSDNFVI
ncbi:MAG: peroxidase family protein [Gammaproteobacteria bacterium]